VRERAEVAAGLQLLARHHGRKAQGLGRLGRGGAADERVELQTHVLEHPSARVQPVDASGGQQPGLHQLVQVGHLLRAPRTKLRHVLYTSLAINSNPALVWWMRSLAIMSGA